MEQNGSENDSIGWNGGGNKFRGNEVWDEMVAEKLVWGEIVVKKQRK